MYLLLSHNLKRKKNYGRLSLVFLACLSFFTWKDKYQNLNLKFSIHNIHWIKAYRKENQDSFIVVPKEFKYFVQNIFVMMKITRDRNERFNQTITLFSLLRFFNILKRRFEPKIRDLLMFKRDRSFTT